MVNNAEKLLLGEKSLEASGIRVRIGEDFGNAVRPDDAFRTGEQGLEQFVLAAHINVNSARTQAWRMGGQPPFDVVVCIVSIFASDELNEAIHGLRS